MGLSKKILTLSKTGLGLQKVDNLSAAELLTLISSSVTPDEVKVKTINGVILTGEGDITIEELLKDSNLNNHVTGATVDGQNVIGGSGNISVGVKKVNGKSPDGEGNVTVETSSGGITSVKTIGGESIEGSGNIPVATVDGQDVIGSSGNIPVGVKTVNGKSPDGEGNVTVETSSGGITSVKTINGISLEGSGDIQVATINGKNIFNSSEDIIIDSEIKTIADQELKGIGNVPVMTINGTQIIGQGGDLEIKSDAGGITSVKTIGGESIEGGGTIGIMIINEDQTVKGITNFNRYIRSINGIDLYTSENLGDISINELLNGSDLTEYVNTESLLGKISNEDITEKVTGATVDGQNVIGGSGDIPVGVKTVNGTQPSSGNIELKTVDGIDLIGSGDIPVGVKTVNGTQPSSGNIELKTIGSGGVSLIADGSHKNIPLKTVDGIDILGSGDIPVGIKTINSQSPDGSGDIDITMELSGTNLNILVNGSVINITQ